VVEEAGVPGENHQLYDLRLRFECTFFVIYKAGHYVIKFVSDLQQVGDFLRTIQLPPPIKLTLSMVVLSKEET
jgi:hypothetical protein